MRLLDVLAKKSSTNPIYNEHLYETLRIVSIPPQMTKASDVLNYARDLQEYFTALGI